MSPPRTPPGAGTAAAHGVASAECIPQQKLSEMMQTHIHYLVISIKYKEHDL